VGNLSSFTAGGADHILLTSPKYRSYTVEGVALSDWVKALAAGEAVADVNCTSQAGGCTEASD